MLKHWQRSEFHIPPKSLAIISCCILYVFNPFDIIPDAIPIIGYIDDVACLAKTFQLLSKEIERFNDFKTNQKAQ